MNGKLYIVPTPIGNLEDITLRALRILKEVDIVLCENTSVSEKLFSHYEIDTKKMSYFARTKIKDKDKIIELLKEGKSLALISDAGTPTISDPGVLLVNEIRNNLGHVDIIPLPGASSLTTALSASGITSSEFVFLGFMPNKKGRETIFKEISGSKRTTVFFESVHRIEKTLESLVVSLKSLANTNTTPRQVVVARELTKIYEEVVRGTAEEVRDYFSKKKDHVRGEFVVIVEGKH